MQTRKALLIVIDLRSELFTKGLRVLLISALVWVPFRKMLRHQHAADYNDLLVEDVTDCPPLSMRKW